MARKSKEKADALAKANLEAQAAVDAAKKAQEEAIKAQEEEAAKLVEVEEKLKEIAKAEGMFAGIVISREELVKILDFALHNLPAGDNIKIPVKVYYEDNPPKE